MSWVETTFPYGSILTSAKMTNMYNNFSALANHDSGSPELWNGFNGMYGFNMNSVLNVNTPLFPEAFEIKEGRCMDAAKTQVIKFDTSLTKMIGSGDNYSFGNSGGAVPSSFSSIWPTQAASDSHFWAGIFIMKNTESGSMDWGIDTDTYSASNLMIEVNSVNGGGWDSFRRLGSMYIYDTNRFIDFWKKGNIFHRNTFVSRYADVTSPSNWASLTKIGPSGFTSLINVSLLTNVVSGDRVYIAPYGVDSYNGDYGAFSTAKGFNNYADEVTLNCNSGNCQVRTYVSTGTINAVLNWWIDPFEP